MTEQERTILSMLSYETPIKEKRKALNQAAEMADIVFLIRPAAFWRSWDYCAAVLLFIEDEKLAPYLPDLLQWVEALNDPGSAYVELRLEAMDPTVLVPALNAFILQHRDADSGDWYYGISGLAYGVCHTRLTKEAIGILDKKRIELEKEIG